MSQGINRYRADLRELRFVLLEQFQLGELLGRGVYEDFSEEDVVGVLREAYRYAIEVAGPLNSTGDRSGCRLVDGQVHAPEGFAAAYRKLYAGGFKSLTVDPEYGGAGAPKCLYVLVNELTSGPNAALDMYGGLTLGAADVIYEFGTAEQKARYCQNMFDGTWAGTMCLTEPQAGSDVGDATSSAQRLPDGSYQIRGQKIFISAGDQEFTENVVHLVLARVEGAPPGSKGLSLFIVPKVRADGRPNDVRVTGIEHKMGLNGSATCSLAFGENGDCWGELVGGQEHLGIRQMFQLMNFARIGVAIQGLGAASSAYLNAVAYARERKQGRTAENAKDPTSPQVRIIEHPDVKRMLLEMKAKVEGSRAMIVKASHHFDSAAQSEDAALRAYHHGQIELLTPLCKAYSSDQAFRVCELAIQVFGGAGYTQDYPVEQYCRDAKIFSIYEGTNHIQALDLAGRKLGQEGGAHFKAFARDVQRFVKQHQEHERLREPVRLLGAALPAVLSVATQFAAWAASNQVARVTLVANTFLQMMSELCVGWLLLEAAVIADAALGQLSASG
ncbi:MAG: hypothetical protein RJA70_1309, partial [Pseudomonadota bacterium]